jgi:hypothetical protein
MTDDEKQQARCWTAFRTLGDRLTDDDTGVLRCLFDRYCILCGVEADMEGVRNAVLALLGCQDPSEEEKVAQKPTRPQPAPFYVEAYWAKKGGYPCRWAVKQGDTTYALFGDKGPADLVAKLLTEHAFPNKPETPPRFKGPFRVGNLGRTYEIEDANGLLVADCHLVRDAELVRDALNAREEAT